MYSAGKMDSENVVSLYIPGFLANTVAVVLAMSVGLSSASVQAEKSLTTMGWIVMTFNTDIHNPQRINPNDFVDLLACHLAISPAGQHFH